MILLFNTNILLTAKCSITHFSPSYGRFKLTKNRMLRHSRREPGTSCLVRAEVRQFKTAVTRRKMSYRTFSSEQNVRIEQ